jgi:hypothetical protein
VEHFVDSLSLLACVADDFFALILGMMGLAKKSSQNPVFKELRYQNP